jgi:hypothetical protein
MNHKPSSRQHTHTHTHTGRQAGRQLTPMQSALAVEQAVKDAPDMKLTPAREGNLVKVSLPKCALCRRLMLRVSVSADGPVCHSASGLVGTFLLTETV